MDIQPVIKDLIFRVLVKCLTYNQSQYIEDALTGFAMQQTNFPYVCLVMDDASTDGEQDVIKNWLNRECDMDNAEFVELELANVIIVPHSLNSNCTFAVYLLKRNLWKEPEQKGAFINPWYEAVSYIAHCEGDDYWTDPLKLQKQCDTLEANPECTICFNRVQAIKADKSGIEYLIPRYGCVFVQGKVTLKDLAVEEFKYGHWCFHTSSFFYRREIGCGIASFKKKHIPSFPYGDMPLQMYALLQGEGYFLSDAMGCYRCFSGGWNSMMAKDPELNREMVRKVIEGFNEFDEYTNYEYHRYVKSHILHLEYNNLYETRPYGLKFLRLNVEHYSFVLKTYLKKKIPNVYSFMKKAKRHGK